MSQDTDSMAEASSPDSVDINPSAGGSVAPNLGSAPQMPAPQQAPSRLGQVLSAVANVVGTGVAGSANQKGRSSFVGGMAGGAQAELQQQAKQQDIKFKTFSDQVRAATLHNQDLALQAHTQEQQDAHEDHMQKMHANDSDWGVKYDTIANDGTAVMDHMKTQTAANGSVSVPPGAHISGDGKTIMIPQDTPETAAGQLSQYKAVGPALGFTLQPPTGATKLDPKVASAFYNKLQGFDANGNIYTADKLPALIAANQSQRDDLAKKGAPQNQLDALDGIVSKQKAQLKADTDASDTAANKTLQRQKELEASKAKDKEEVNAAKPQKVNGDMYVGTDADGNQIAGTNDDLKTAGAKGVTKLEGGDKSKVITARQLTSPEGLFSQINQDMRALDAKGKMGSAGEARFHDALLEKAGSDPDYAPLITHTHLLATALMQAHVGSKGSENMMEEFKNLANAGKMSASTLRSALGAEYKYVHEKAMLPKQKAGQ